MKQNSSIPVEVKCRLGVDDFDDYSFLHKFIQTVSGEGIDHFIIHARYFKSCICIDNLYMNSKERPYLKKKLTQKRIEQFQN